jgi:hypothetical protein
VNRQRVAGQLIRMVTLCRFEKGQSLFGYILLQIGISVKPDCLVLRTVFYTAVALLGDTIHQLGYDFQIINFTHDSYFFHDSPLLGHLPQYY